MRMVQAKEAELWTSVITLSEVYKKKCDGIEVSTAAEKDKNFVDLLNSEFVMLVQVDADIGNLARSLLRTHDMIRKPFDAIHLATAIQYDLDEFHTFDGVNLLPLNGSINRSDGLPLPVIVPPLPFAGTLLENAYLTGQSPPAYQ